MTTKNYKLGKTVEMTVTYNAEEMTALIKCNNNLYMDGFVYRQEKFIKDAMTSGSTSPYVIEMEINYKGTGAVRFKFPKLIGMIKFSDWLLTDNALKQIKTAIIELKEENGEMKSPRDYEELIDKLYNM